MVESEKPTNPNRAECLLLALVITMSFITVPWWIYGVTASKVARLIQQAGGFWPTFSQLYFDFLTLIIGLLLVIGSPRKYGLCIGDIRQNWGRVLLAIGIPLTVCTIGCLFVPLPAWIGANIGIWLISPFAQDLVFAGFLYTTIEPAFPGNIHPRVPVRKTLLITGVFFSLHHVPGFLVADAWFVWFQLCYTYAGFVCAGLTRQWTNSMLYLTVSHTAGNFIAWCFARGI